MDTLVIFLAILTATMIVVTYQAKRMGNEKRDLALLGAITGMCGAGTAAAAIL